MYIKFLPSEYVLRYRNGKMVSEGAGLSFFYRERNTTACAVPIANTDTEYLFEKITNDYQNVTIQGHITYRVIDFKAVAEAVDFTVNLKTRQYNDTPLKKLSKRVINQAEVMLKQRLSAMNLTEALQSCYALAAEGLATLKEAPELKTIGIEVVDFSVWKISANNETMRALEAATREAVLRQADDALYERRNASIEQERKVKENELSTDITVEEKKKKIKETEISTKRMVLEKENEFARIKIESEAQREKIRLEAEIELEQQRRELAELRLENARKDADAEAYRISAVMAAYNTLSADVLVALATLNMEPEQIIARAFDKLAVNSEKIGTLNISPELLESLRKKVSA